MQKQIDLQGMQFGKKTDQVLKAAAEPIDAPDRIVAWRRRDTGDRIRGGRPGP